jgi:hypothetical protein
MENLPLDGWITNVLGSTKRCAVIDIRTVPDERKAESAHPHPYPEVVQLHSIGKSALSMSAGRVSACMDPNERDPGPGYLHVPGAIDRPRLQRPLRNLERRLGAQARWGHGQ